MTEGIIISAIPRDYVMHVWPDVEGFIADALQYTYGRYEPEDILAQLLDDSHLLWVAFEDGKPKGAVVTYYAVYPRKKYLGCPFVTGDEFSTWKVPMLRTLQKFAAENGCEGLEATARLGWSRVFKEDGYEALWQTFQLPAAPLGGNDG